MIGDDEAIKNKFKIRLFNKENFENNEETLYIDDSIKLDNWLNKNLLMKST